MSGITRLRAGTSFKQTSTDTAVVLTAGSMVDGTNRPAAAMISCQTNTVRYAFNATPVQAAGGLGHDLANAEEIWIESSSALKAMKVISAANGAHGVLTITPFFEL